MLSSRRDGLVIGVLALALGASAPSGQTVRVVVKGGGPGLFENIQLAVDAADPGDVVLVGPGPIRWSRSTGSP